MKASIGVRLSLFGLLLAASGYAQMLSVKAKIDFPFTAAGKLLPAGQYTFTYDTDTIRVIGATRGAEAQLPIEERLAAEIHTTPSDSHIVFDKLGDKYILSEVWIVGADGFMVYRTAAAHTHAVINVPR